MKSGLIKLQYILLTLFIASIVIFKQYNFNIAHFINIALLLVFVILNFIERERRYKVNVIIVLYALFILISLASSLWGVDIDNPSFKTLQLFLILINLFVIYNIVKKYNCTETFFNGILLGSLVNYLIMLGMIPVSFDIYIGSGLGARAVGTMGNPNILATAMLLSMLISMLYLFQKAGMSKLFYYYQFVNLFMAGYLILLTVSKKGIILGLLLCLIYVAIALRSKQGLVQMGIFAIVGIIAAKFILDGEQLTLLLEYAKQRFDTFSDDIAGLNTATDSSTAIRKRLVEFGLTAFQSSPLLGYGLDNFRFLTTSQYAHNNPVELLVGTGIIGTVVYYSMHAFLLKKIYDMEASEIKYFLYFFVFFLLLMDLTTVSYGVKLIIFAMLYMSIIAESEKKRHLNKKATHE